MQEIVIVHSLYLCGLTAAKNSILFFYLRVFPDNRFRIVVWATIAFNIISTIVISVLNFTVGGAIGNLLNVKNLSTLEPKDYIPSIRVVLISCSVNLAVDVWMLILPMTQLYNIGLKLNKKISVISMFGLGVFLVRTILTGQLYADPAEAGK
uniref:WGS project CBMI000000000 data, contig CS3069_c002452 n=1 Tax=Fusarium clavum TaxID=2594811 RepID=A0A090MCQ5_9HYPO|nr:unnamed protein product [Fusarium clavum]